MLRETYAIVQKLLTLSFVFKKEKKRLLKLPYLCNKAKLLPIKDHSCNMYYLEVMSGCVIPNIPATNIKSLASLSKLTTCD